MIKSIDKLLSRILLRDIDVDQMRNFSEFHNKTQQDGSCGFVIHKFESGITAKVAPLLSHVSIMIAGLVVIISSFNIETYKKL